MKHVILASLLFLSGCATVGPVSIEPDDTIVTVGLAFLAASMFLFVKSSIEYFFAKKLEKFKDKLNKGE